jgi:hypothetical protein
MKRNWIYTIVALIAAAAAVVFAFLAGKQWDWDPDDDPEENLEDPDLKDNHDGKG